MKKQFLIIIFILISLTLSINLFARRSGGQSGGRSFSSRKAASSYSGSSSRPAKSYSKTSSYSGTKRKGTGYYDPTNTNKKVGVYIEDDGSDFLFYIIAIIIMGILWFIYNIAGGKEFIGEKMDKFFKKADDTTYSDETIISFKLLIENLDFDLVEKIYFFNEENNIRIHKILPILVENEEKITKFSDIKIESKLKFNETENKVKEIIEEYKKLNIDEPNSDIYLVSIVASYTSKLNISQKNNYSSEEFKELLKELLKLNKYIIIDNVKHSNVIVSKVYKNSNILDTENPLLEQ